MSNATDFTGYLLKGADGDPGMTGEAGAAPDPAQAAQGSSCNVWGKGISDGDPGAPGNAPDPVKGTGGKGEDGDSATNGTFYAVSFTGTLTVNAAGGAGGIGGTGGTGGAGQQGGQGGNNSKNDCTAAAGGVGGIGGIGGNGGVGGNGGKGGLVSVFYGGDLPSSRLIASGGQPGQPGLAGPGGVGGKGGMSSDGKAPQANSGNFGVPGNVGTPGQPGPNGKATVFKQSLPTVTSMNPLTGPAAGGTPFTIAGTGFVSQGITVQIGGANATISSCTATQIQGSTPAGTAGSQFVVVTNIDGGVGVLHGTFQYTS